MEARSILEKIAPHFHKKDGFVYPDWDTIADYLFDRLPQEQWDEAFLAAAIYWADLLGQEFGSDYRSTSSENILLLSNCAPKKQKEYLTFYEQALQHILAKLPGVAQPEDYGKLFVILIEDTEDYYHYISHFYGDGEFPQSGGIFITGGGHGHIAMPQDPWGDGFSQSTFLHELTHSCVAHLPLPLWLNEALAMEIDGTSGRLDDQRDNGDPFAAHYRFWNSDTIQDLWNGEVWNDAEHSNLGYEISQILWQQARRDLGLSEDQLLSFAKEANWKDGGEAAFQQHCGLQLGDLAGRFLGPGTWNCTPGQWRQ